MLKLFFYKQKKHSLDIIKINFFTNKKSLLRLIIFFTVLNLSFLLKNSFAQKTSSTVAVGLAPKFVLKKIEEIKLRRYPLTSKSLFRKLRKVYDLIEKKEYQLAKKLVLKLLKKSKKMFEIAQIKQTFAHLYIVQNYLTKAITPLQEALNLKVLPLGPTLSIKYNIVQILIGQGKYVLAQKKLEDWFTFVEFPQAQAYVLYANLLFAKGQKKAALVNINHALSLPGHAQESWLSLAVSLNYEVKDYIRAEKILRQLVEINPNKQSYWQQLVRTQLLLNIQLKALSSLELAYKQKVLKKEKDYLDLIYLYLHSKIPLGAIKLIKKYMASGVLKKNKKNYQLLSKAWVQAGEPKKAIEPLKKAANYASDGKIYMELGQIYMGEEKWAKALFFFQKSIVKKGLKEKKDWVFLMLGITHFKLSKPEQSLKYFNLAMVSDNDKITDNAQDWLSYISKIPKNK